ncbi:hypothetical protein RD792_003558 [Penstemon davidsonii]|uniref:PP2A regulatory subunit B'' EF-hand domain-containing protein n=1 Tax=Penstemon davidsonii TaxID=160366 RepID=A0ABR0DF33_9LAMI|nr:hypothetical protein RD792_003558 [Penstemon davidsonii]
MDMDSNGEIASLDAELLQLPEVSPLAMKANPYVAEKLFDQWLSLPETSSLVKSLLNNAKGGSPINVSGTSSSANAATINSLPSMFLAGSTPPLSPRSSPGSPRIMKHRVGPSVLGSPLKLVNEPVKELLPQVQSLDVLVFVEVVGFFPHLLLNWDAFVDYWINGNMLTKDVATQIYSILKQPHLKYLVQDDFKPLLRELLATHPGLEFLQSTPEFQERYAETVIYRIFYYVNRSGNGCLTLRELKRSNLIVAMQHADEEEDINKVLRYFSYEHFYVIYCKFWELDTDHDFLIDKENLIRYGNHALTYRIVDRIFSQLPRKFSSKVEGKMGYEDFVNFILSEEDKSSEPSLEYWFISSTEDLLARLDRLGASPMNLCDKQNVYSGKSLAKVKSLLNNAKGGSPINVSGTSSSANAATINSLPSMFLAGSTPPLSPRSSPGSPRIMKHRVGPSVLGSPLKLVNEPVKELLPQVQSLDVLVFVEVVGFFPHLLLNWDAFVDYWINGNMLTKDVATQIYSILKQPHLKYLVQDDFKPLLRELLATHPGLEFLQSTPEFQERYAETVIYRIFYYVNRSGNGCLTLRELKRSNLIVAMQHADEEEDINKVLRYFSYEHFYVIYCKFWELDTDHDFLIDKENLIRYGNHALTYRIVDRIFSQVPRKFSSKVEGKMGYEDFVNFILSEEDKSSEPSLEYWFISSTEDLLARLDRLGASPMNLCDKQNVYSGKSLAKDETYFTLHDLKGSRLSGNVFNILFNLNKFMAFETRDPFLIRQERENPTFIEWDRFAHREYIRLSMEEDAEDASNGSADVWDESLEAPF